MKKFLFLLSALAALSATADIRWLERDYDFGLFKEIAGPKTGTSRFVNLGPDTLAIINVKPSCGCTTASFTDRPLAPGDTATVSYTYDPTMRPGKFEKSVRVTLSDGSRHRIGISGNVLGTPESLATLYPVEAGPMRLSDRAINFGNVTYGRTPIAFLNAYVLSQDSIIPSLKSPLKGLTITPSVEKAGPGDVITFSLYLDTRQTGTYGPFSAAVADENIDGGINISANILPDVDSEVLRQGGKNPAIDITPASGLDLGAVDTQTIKAQLTIANNGKGTLEILRVYSPSDAITFDKLPGAVKAGKSAKLKFSVDPRRLSAGPQRQEITIITNDPLHPVTTVPLPVYKQ